LDGQILNTLNVVSAGAARAVVEKLVGILQQEDAGLLVNARYGAVQDMKACVMTHQAVDVVVLTDRLLHELADNSLVVAASCHDLGAVGTGIAVRADTPPPDVSSPQRLTAALLACARIFVPHPATTSAGKVFLQALDELGIQAQVLSRLVPCSSGHDAMAQLARSTGPTDIGVMQITEILASKDLRLAGPLPGALQRHTVYSAAVATHAHSPDRALAFIQRLVSQKDELCAAGFGQAQAPTAAT
jgi:molybdate transport system substrate-binding protein